jgi:hypothetical protein
MKLLTRDFLRSAKRAKRAALILAVIVASPALADEAVLAISPKVIEF